MSDEDVFIESTAHHRMSGVPMFSGDARLDDFHSCLLAVSAKPPGRSWHPKANPKAVILSKQVLPSVGPVCVTGPELLAPQRLPTDSFDNIRHSL